MDKKDEMIIYGPWMVLENNIITRMGFPMVQFGIYLIAFVHKLRWHFIVVVKFHSSKNTKNSNRKYGRLFVVVRFEARAFSACNGTP